MEAGSACCVPGCFSNSKRDVNLSFYGFPKEKNLRKRWLHKISRKNFSASTGHRVCNSAFRRRQKNLHEQCSCYFSFGKVPSKTVTQSKEKGHFTHQPSTSSQETPSTFNSTASSTTENDESEREDTQIERLREELQNVLRLKESLKKDLFIFKFGLRRFKDSDKDMSYHACLTYGQVVALFKFLNAQMLKYNRLNI